MIAVVAIAGTTYGHPLILAVVALGLLAMTLQPHVTDMNVSAYVGFAPFFAIPAIIAAGWDWQLLATIMVAVIVSEIRLQGRGWMVPGLTNGTASVLMACASLMAFQVAEPALGFWAGVIAAVAASTAVETVIDAAFCWLCGESLVEFSQGLARNTLSYMAFSVPLIGIATGAVQHQTILALGLFGPLVLVIMSTRSDRELAVSEYRLGLDQLTGIANRTGWWRSLEDAIQWHDSRSECLALVMIDIDNFKKLNDTHGHVEGDTALVAVAHALRDTVRGGDVVARFGGEEFCVMIASCTGQEAAQIAERLREVSEVALGPWGTTISAGVEIREPQDRRSPVQLLDSADQRLYAAKRNGKNVVMMAGADGQDEPVGHLAEVVQIDRFAA